MTETTARIVEIIRAIPEGQVMCYRDVARAAGLPNGARQAVRVLHSLGEKEKLPWHRVIRADGFIGLDAGRGGDLQAALLGKEGLVVKRIGGRYRVSLPSRSVC